MSSTKFELTADALIHGLAAKSKITHILPKHPLELQEKTVSKSSPSARSAKKAGNKKMIRKYAKCKIKPVAEKFLRTLAESVTQRITETVRTELQNGVDTLKKYLDDRLHLSHSIQRHMNCTNDGGRNENLQNSIDVSSCNPRMQNREAQAEFEQQNDKIKDVVVINGVLGLGHTVIEQRAALQQDSLLQDIDTYEIGQKQSTKVDTLLKYVSSGTLVESLNTSIEKRDNDENLNPADVFNMSISSLESESNNTFIQYPKFSIGMVKEESSSGAEETFGSDSYLELFTTNNAHFLDLSQEQKEQKLKPPMLVANEPCTAVLQTLPLTTVSNNGSKTPSNSELLIKSDAEFRKSKRHLICEVCDRSFLNNSSLKQHMSFHRPQRPYQCDHDGCLKSYKTRSELNRHLIVHTGQKNYECQKCGKAFLRKQYLKTHLIRHNEGLTRQCSLCAKIFVCEQDLNKHKISYHRNGKRTLHLITEQLNKPEMIYIDDSLEA